MIYTYLTYQSNGAQGEIVSAKKLTLKELQKAVGGYIEVICLPDDKLMVVNEEGLIHNLPLNIKASSIASRQIVGDVLVCDIDAID